MSRTLVSLRLKWVLRPPQGVVRAEASVDRRGAPARPDFGSDQSQAMLLRSLSTHTMPTSRGRSGHSKGPVAPHPAPAGAVVRAIPVVSISTSSQDSSEP